MYERIPKGINTIVNDHHGVRFNTVAIIYNYYPTWNIKHRIYYESKNPQD